MKKSRGCKRPVNKKVWEIKECFICGGKNKRCKHCKGTNRIAVNRCPRAMSQPQDVLRLLPYCIRYMDFGQFPDGGPMIDQPKVLVDMFNIYISYFRQFEKDSLEAK